MESLGRHLILEMWDCDDNVINDVDKIRELLNAAAKDAGAIVIKSFSHKFSPFGVTGVALLAESHISIHTWPEEGYVAVDIFTCGTAANPQLAVQRLLVELKPKNSTSIELKRGSLQMKELSLSDAL